MARFVLVHGALSGVWSWGPLIDHLKAGSRSVEAFDVPGLGDRHASKRSCLEWLRSSPCELLATAPNRRS
jgi:hypothetical protein